MSTTIRDADEILNWPSPSAPQSTGDPAIQHIVKLPIRCRSARFDAEHVVDVPLVHADCPLHRNRNGRIYGGTAIRIGG